MYTYIQERINKIQKGEAPEEFPKTSLGIIQQRELVEQLCGSWSKDESIPEIFDEIAKQRKRSVPRDITFDLPS